MAEKLDKLVKYTRKVQFSVVRSVGQRKRSGPRRQSNPWPGLTLELLSYRETRGELKHFFVGTYVARVLYTARIGNVESVMCRDGEIKMEMII